MAVLLGSWTCQGCYVINSVDTIECPACETAKPGHEKEVEERQAQTSAAATVNKFGGGATSSTGFGVIPFGSAGAISGAGFGKAAGGGFSFGGPSLLGAGMGNKTGSSSSISSIGSLTFGQKAADVSSDSNKVSDAPVKFTFGQPTATQASSTPSGTVTTTASSIMSKLATSVPKPTIDPTKFGGLTFSSPVVVTPDKQQADKAAESKSPPKSNPFASFSFGASSGAATSVAAEADSSSSSQENSSMVFGSTTSQKVLLFC